MSTTLTINYNKLNAFTALPTEVSSICKYNGVKFPTDCKLIYCYLAKLQHDGKLNNSGAQSFETMMQRFGISSKATLSKYMTYLKDVGLVESDTSKGKTNQYVIREIDLSLVSYPSVSHIADSNKNKVAAAKIEVQAETHEQPKKVSNFVITQKYRKLYEDQPAKLKEFNRFAYKADQDNIKLTTQMIAEHMQSWSHQTDEQPEVNAKDFANLGFEPTIVHDAEARLFEDCAHTDQDLVSTWEDEQTPKADKAKLEKFIDHGVVDDIPPSFGIGWFAAPLHTGKLDRGDTIKYLSVLYHRGVWDEYNPTQDQIDSMLDVLNRPVSKPSAYKETCSMCRGELDDKGHCKNNNCIPF